MLMWYANPSLTRPDVDCDMWQYSWTGRINGISKGTDLNYSYVEQEREKVDKEIPEWAEEAMDWAVKEGINDGIVQNETELQTVVMLYRYHMKFGSK